MQTFESLNKELIKGVLSLKQTTLLLSVPANSVVPQSLISNRIHKGDAV